MNTTSKRAFSALAFGVLTLFAGAQAIAGDLSVIVRNDAGAPVGDAVVTARLKDGTGTRAAGNGKVHRINQRDTAYHPTVSVIPAGTSVEFNNSDGWGHHVYSFSSAKKFDITVPSNKTSESIVFEKPGVVVIGCNIHDRMLAYIYVNGEGQPAKTDKRGIARFAGLPAGGYEISAWHPALRSRRKRPTSEIAIAQDGTVEAALTIRLKASSKKKKRKKSRY